MMLLSLFFLFTLTAAASVIPPKVSPASPASSASPAGCRKSLPKGQSAGKVSSINITSSGERRTFLLSLPPKYHPDTPAPVILSYHGNSRDAEYQLGLDRLTSPEFNSAAVVIYPQGIDEKWQGMPGVATDDVRFTSDILDLVQDQYCIDSARISATGKSAGGGLCNLLACDPELSSRIAAFAPVSGAFYIDSQPCRPESVQFPCRPGRKDVPFLEFHGGKDDTIAYQGGARRDECLPSIPHFVRQWATRDDLGTQNTTTAVSRDAVAYEFGQGEKAGLVKHVFDSVIGHDWPSTAPNQDNQREGHGVASYDATPMILDFFAKHALRNVRTCSGALGAIAR
ncbi:hypothetical protein ED733_008655 [Metarhizium rileyi]|uniref:feruloyl esterase n=1 Tax=Metarhizium rileyi (strain RCEF 4871) TaxID=1649241 RepID=A0A5C6GIL6_METRR|nr:hypothetical protein ED733_008655 [Metarhizium rileyi]